jgi:hypothetical protein
LNLNTIINTAIYYWVTELGFATASPSVAATFFFFPLPRAHCFSCAAINRRRRYRRRSGFLRPDWLHGR